METIILYLIKVNIAFAILYVLYKLVFGKDTFLNLKRYILLFICMASVLYPFIQFGFTLNSDNEALNSLLSLQNILLPETVISTAQQKATSINWLPICTFVYITGMLLLTIRSIIEIVRISVNISQSKRVTLNGINICVAKDNTEPYSFFKWICLSPDLYKKQELNEILYHEQTHARELHSIDVLFIQLILVLNWFNPFVWLLRKEIRINHEYLADRQVINSGYNKKSYQYHLIGFTQTHSLSTAIYNNFSVLPLKSRLKMLNRKATPGFMVYKYLLLLPVLSILVVFSNCQGYDSNDQFISNEPEKVIPEETVFEIVESMPQFPGGQGALMQYLNRNIKYPTEAQKQGVQGRVIVQFVVSADGSIQNPVVVRSVEESMDKEALRVISAMPAWIPGQQRGRPVNVKYTVPISFRLQ